MKALFAKVTNIKSFPSTGMVRVEIEAPVEQFPAIVALLHDQQVLVTQAPFLGVPYGVVDPQPDGRALPTNKSAAANPSTHDTTKPSHNLGARCKWAVMRCKELVFQEWIIDEFRPDWEQAAVTLGALSEEDLALWLILKICGIESRKQLDTDPAAAKIFDEKIRVPYSKAA